MEPHQLSCSPQKFSRKLNSLLKMDFILVSSFVASESLALLLWQRSRRLLSPKKALFSDNYLRNAPVLLLTQN